MYVFPLNEGKSGGYFKAAPRSFVERITDAEK